MDNILIISDFPDVQYKKDSGTPSFRLIVEALAKRYKIHMIAPDGEGKSNDIITYHRIPVKTIINGSSRLAHIINKKFRWYNFTSDAFIKSLELEKQYDFKLVYGAGCNSVYVAAKVGQRVGIASIGRLFGTYLYPFLNNPVSLLLRFDEVLAFKSKCTKFIITNDGTVGDEVAEHFGIPKERFHFWRNGVDRPLDKIIYDDTIRVISLARLESWKHVERIIEAFAEVAHENMVLDIVGGGPEESNLRELVRLIEIEDMVTFHGEVSRERALELLSNSDIFMSTNDYSNISNSLMEAMSAGKGIVVLDSGATSSMIDGTNGFAVNEDELSAALSQMFNKEIRVFFGYKAKQYAANHFESWESRIRKEVAVCEGLIGRRS